MVSAREVAWGFALRRQRSHGCAERRIRREPPQEGRSRWSARTVPGLEIGGPDRLHRRAWRPAAPAEAAS